MTLPLLLIKPLLFFSHKVSPLTKKTTNRELKRDEASLS